MGKTVTKHNTVNFTLLAEKLKKINWWKKWLILIVISLAVGYTAESLYEMNIRNKVMDGGWEVGTELIDSEFIEAENGKQEATNYVFEEKGKIIINLPERYVNKLQYYYSSENNFQIKIKIQKKDEYGNEDRKTIKDMSRSNLNFSVVNVKESVSSIVMQVPEGVTVGDFKIVNETDFNGYRALYVAVFAALILFVFFFGREIAKRLELGFLFICLSIGILLIAIQPPQCMSWDEHIHMYKSFDLFETGETWWTQSEYYLYTNPETMDGVPFMSKEEKAMQMDYLNTVDSENVYSYERGGFALNYLGYLHMAAANIMGRVLNMPFYLVYLAGKMANLLLYAVVFTLAIKVIPICKKTLAVIGLMPTSLVLATAYSYDVAVIAFIFLGMALLIREYYYPKRKITTGKIILIFFCFLFGSAPKAVYIPFILSFLFLPNDKFRSKKIAWIWKGSCVLLCGAMMLTFILPAAGDKMGGDARGGDTDVYSQLCLILENPAGYVKVLYRSIAETFHSYMLGKSNLSTMAYAGLHEWYLAVTALVFGIGLTEPRETMSTDGKKSLFRLRMVLAVLTVGIIVLIWTALYLVFTEIGATTIEGVQGRYYLPLAVAIMTIFYTDKIRTVWNERRYNTLMFLIVLLIWHQALYTKFLLPYCI